MIWRGISLQNVDSWGTQSLMKRSIDGGVIFLAVNSFHRLLLEQSWHSMSLQNIMKRSDPFLDRGSIVSSNGSTNSRFFPLITYGSLRDGNWWKIFRSKAIARRFDGFFRRGCEDFRQESEAGLLVAFLVARWRERLRGGDAVPRFGFLFGREMALTSKNGVEPNHAMNEPNCDIRGA